MLKYFLSECLFLAIFSYKYLQCVSICRFGKPMAIDMGDSDLFKLVTTQVNALQDDLMDRILDKRILKEEQ